MSTDTLPSGGGRRMAARRRAQQRRRRQKLLAAGLAAVLAVGVGLVALLGGGEDDGGEDPGVAPVRSQRTLLLQVQDSARNTVSNALLAEDPATGDASVVLVPPQVLASPPGSQSVPFGSVRRSTSLAAARDALADLMAVTVDGTWLLDSSALVSLVDGLGGLSADVDVQVVGGRGGRQVLLSPGTQRLSGRQAYAFASYRAPGEQEQSRLARLQEVLDGLLDELPDAPALRQRVERLGTGSVVQGLDAAGLAEVLLAVRGADGRDALQYDTLPVIPVETGAAEPSLRVDTDATRVLVDRLLAASVPPGARAGNNRVKVFNGVGTPMLGNAVRARLVEAGLVFVGSANASRFGIERTEVQIGEPTPEALALGQRVARALGVPASAVRSSQPTSVADVVVVVGADFDAG